MSDFVYVACVFFSLTGFFPVHGGLNHMRAFEMNIKNARMQVS